MKAPAENELGLLHKQLSKWIDASRALLIARERRTFPQYVGIVTKAGISPEESRLMLEWARAERKSLRDLVYSHNHPSRN